MCQALDGAGPPIINPLSLAAFLSLVNSPPLFNIYRDRQISFYFTKTPSPSLHSSMDSCISPRTTPMLESLSITAKTPKGGAHSSWCNVGFPPPSPRRSSPRPQSRVHASPDSARNIYARRSKAPLVLAVAKTEAKDFKSSGVGTPHTPHMPSSPEGKFLSSVLQNQPHLFKFAVSGQLDELVSAKDGASAGNTQNPDSTSSILQRRIEKVKEKERQTAVEDIMYMTVVHKFSELELPMTRDLSEYADTNNLEMWPSKFRELESIHSIEVQELIREHVATTLRLRGKFSPMDGATTIDRLHLGRIYAASIMYGYFLKSACFRRELDLSVAGSLKDDQPLGQGAFPLFEPYSSGSRTPMPRDNSTNTQVATMCEQLQKCNTRPEKLGSYIKGFDSEALQRCAKLKSKEAVNVIEKHTWALFGNEDLSQGDSDKNMSISFSSLEKLVLEAVAFGTFLWDVESSVDSVYGLKEN